MSVNSSRIKSIWKWITRKGYEWLSVFFILLTLVIILRPNTTEPIVRITGLILQLIGISTVIWGISETKELFGHPSIAKSIKQYIKEFPLFRRKVILGAATISIGSPTLNAGALITHGTGGEDSFEARLLALEKYITSINDRVTQMQNEMDKEFQMIHDNLKDEEQLRKTDIQLLSQKLEITEIGGLRISSIGAIFLFVGLILSTAAPEIVCLLN